MEYANIPELMAETSTMTAHCPVQQWPSQEYQFKTVGFSSSVYMCKESKVVPQ